MIYELIVTVNPILRKSQILQTFGKRNGLFKDDFFMIHYTGYPKTYLTGNASSLEFYIAEQWLMITERPVLIKYGLICTFEIYY